MDRITNKELARQFIKGITEHNWVLIENLLHDDYHSDPALLRPPRVKFAINPFLEFLKLLDYDEIYVSKAEEIMAGPTDKQSTLQELKLNVEIVEDWELHELIGEDDKVWGQGSYIVKDPQNLNLALEWTIKIWFRDGRIVTFVIIGRYLNSLIHYGRLIIERDNQEEIDHYLDGLRKIGILPTMLRV